MPKLPKPNTAVIRHALQHIALFVHGKRIEAKVWEKIETIIAEVEKLEWRQMTPEQRKKIVPLLEKLG